MYDQPMIPKLHLVKYSTVRTNPVSNTQNLFEISCFTLFRIGWPGTWVIP